MKIYAGSDPLPEEALRGLAEDEQLIHYVMDLEELIHWLAIPYMHADPTTGEPVVEQPIWPKSDPYGNPLPANERLDRTWQRIFTPATRPAVPGE